MATFYQSTLKAIPTGLVISRVYPPEVAKHISLEERLGDCKCPECKNDKWIILPKECSAVVQGGKPYVECLNCGYTTHL